VREREKERERGKWESGECEKNKIQRVKVEGRRMSSCAKEQTADINGLIFEMKVQREREREKQMG